MTYIEEPGLEGTSLLVEDLRVDFFNGAVDKLAFGFALNSFTEDDIANFKVFNSSGELLSSTTITGTYTTTSSGQSNFPEGYLEVIFSGVASYATFDFTSDYGRFIIDNFSGTFGSTEIVDPDGDGINDSDDNCPDIANPGQENNDGIADAADNCQFTANADQSDIDGDGQGDVCDGDSDGDGIANDTDNCPAVANTDQSNNDGDDQGDACDPDDDNDGVADDQPDNCPLTANSDQDDLDSDNIGDACDLDIDGDGVENVNDNCAWTANIGQEDTDFDGFGDACDDDDDNDGVLDTADNCSLISNPGQEDADEDGQGDVCDGDLDGDGVANETDNCPNVANGSQADYDKDGTGDVCDSDVDGDDVANDSDACAFTELDFIVDAAGCSIDQLCPCEGPRGIASLWKNHGKFVSCTAKSAESFVEDGLITEAEKDAIVSDAAQSDCGDKK